MTVAVIVGTDKGAAIMRSDAARERWEVDALQLPGWKVTATTRDAQGRFYAAVASVVYGAAIVVSDDLKTWRQLEHPPQYKSTDRGNPGHYRFIRGMDFPAIYTEQRRYIDQIWRLKAIGDVPLRRGLRGGPVPQRGPRRIVAPGARAERAPLEANVASGGGWAGPALDPDGRRKPASDVGRDLLGRCVPHR